MPPRTQSSATRSSESAESGGGRDAGCGTWQTGGFIALWPRAADGRPRTLGDKIATYYQKHAAEYGSYYMIWRQRIWKATDPIGQWTAMSRRGSPTANHVDHMHITVTNGVSGTAFAQALLRAQDSHGPAKRPR